MKRFFLSIGAFLFISPAFLLLFDKVPLYVSFIGLFWVFLLCLSSRTNIGEKFWTWYFEQIKK
jgi:hypothetical protein